MSTVGADDLVIRVRLDTTQAKEEWSKQEKAAKEVGSAASSGLGRGLVGMGANAAASALSFIFGESASKSWANIHAVGSNIGRTTFLGQQIERDTADRMARESARAQTSQMLGPAGSTASRDQIMALYNALLRIEKRELYGQNDVQKVIDAEQAKKTLDDLKFLLTNFTDVLRELWNGFGRNRPEIK